nr:cytochrome c3 family protein [Pirellula sp.]
QFQSFAEGHPEFESYPPNKPRSIGFDHARHAELHFAKKGKTFDCNVCHLQSKQSGLVGSVFRSVSFEQSCSECHSEPLKSAGIEGLVVFQVPSIDRAKLLKYGHDIGPWPESASLMMEGELTPLLVHMLRSTDDGRAILEKLPKTGRLKDVNLDDPAQSKAIADLTKFVRETWEQLSADGQPMLKRWLEMKTDSRAIATSSSNSSRLELYARFVASRSSLEPSVQPVLNLAGMNNNNKETWVNQLATGVPPDLLRSASQKWFRHEPRHAISVPSSSDEDRLPLAKKMPPAINPISLRFEPIIASNTTQDDDDLLSGTDLDALKLEGNESQKPLDTNKPLKPWEHLPFGGWMIDDNRVALVYVPIGHADPWVSRWIEWNLLVHNELAAPDFQDPFLKQCIQCHSFDNNRILQMLNQAPEPAQRGLQSNGAIPINHMSSQDINGYCWKIEQRPNAIRELTKFNHTPHLSINSLRDCKSCHSLKKLNDQQVSEQGWSDRGRTIRSEFVPIEKDQCASCHTNRSAGDACTQCHNYHVHGLFPNQ